jgi:hypothetical protein
MKVDKGIKLPKKFPFDDMAIGDSFAVPNNINRQAISVAALRYGIKHQMKFTVRLVEDRSLRCWRVS